jgi:hypothetical protein
VVGRQVGRQLAHRHAPYPGCHRITSPLIPCVIWI